MFHKSKLMSLLLVSALLLILAPAVVKADSTSTHDDGLVTWTYTISDDGTSAAITNAVLDSGITSLDALAIPTFVPNVPGSSYVPVTSVSGIRGIGSASVNAVHIPRYVTTISDNAFMDCSNIKGFVFDCSNLTTIGASAFAGITAMTSMDLPDTVTTIGDNAFSLDTNLTGITIPDKVTILSKDCFNNCSSLASVKLPDGLTEIGLECFNFCRALPSINFPSGLKTIGAEAFNSCGSLKSIDLPDTITSIENRAFFGCYQMTDAIIRSGALKSYSFAYCDALENVTLGEGVTRLDSFTFVYTHSLKSLAIPASVTFIGRSVLWDCPSLTDLTVAADNANYCSENNIIYNRDKTSLIICSPGLSGEVKVSDTVTEIQYYGFSSCTKLTSITMPEGLTSIGDYAFDNCTALTRIVFKGACPTFGQKRDSSLTAYYPVKYADSWAAYTLTGKQAYANVTWDLCDGSEPSTTIENVSSGLISGPADPSRDGYAFDGWYTSTGSDAVKWDFTTSTVSDDITLYAHWRGNQYTITFDSNGGSPVAPITANCGSPLTAPADPTREGYTFAGWSPEFPAVMPSNNVTLTAQWTANNYSYSVVYYYDGVRDDSKTESGNAAFASSVSTYPDKCTTGHKLDHDTAPLTITTDPAANVLSVYYVMDNAQWFTVTFEAGENGSLSGTTSFTNILAGTDWSTAVTVPTPVPALGYKFDKWMPDFPNTVTESATYTAIFAAIPANQAPIANDDTYTTAPGTMLTVSATGILTNDTDADENALMAVLVSGTTHGTLKLNSNGSFIYTPAKKYKGTDSFTYKANDGITDSNAATVTITIKSSSIVTSITISGSQTIWIPRRGTTSMKFTAKVYDQNGVLIKDEAVTWSLEGAGTGISIDENGIVAVSSSAIPGTFTIVATSTTNPAVTASMTVTLKR